MAWVCSPSETNCIIKFYSIADDLSGLNEYVFSFLMGLSPGIWALIIVTTVITLVIAILLSVNFALKRMADVF